MSLTYAMDLLNEAALVEKSVEDAIGVLLNQRFEVSLGDFKTSYMEFTSVLCNFCLGRHFHPNPNRRHLPLCCIVAHEHSRRCLHKMGDKRQRGDDEPGRYNHCTLCSVLLAILFRHVAQCF